MIRRTFGLFLAVGIIGTSIGCFDLGPKQPETPVNAGPATGDKEHTLEYWGKVREVMSQKAARTDTMQQVAVILRRQADTIRRLPIDSVDRELYETANTVAHYQEKQLKAADAASYKAESLRADPELVNAYKDAGMHLTAAVEALKALRGKLSARYSVQFPPIEDK